MPRLLTTLFTIIISSISFAHGENTVGPNGGKIEMPGPYHIELVRRDNQTIDFYLLDMDFKNPTTKNSSIKAMTIGGTLNNLSCKEMKNYFSCTSSLKLPPKGSLQIESRRDGITGNVVVMEFRESAKKAK